MNDERTLFAQVLDFLPLHEFRKCVRRYRGDYKVQSFSCLDQFLCLSFAQLTYRESLRAVSYTHLDVYKRQVLAGADVTSQDLYRDFCLFYDESIAHNIKLKNDFSRRVSWREIPASW